LSSGPPPREPAIGDGRGIRPRLAVITVVIWAVDATERDDVVSLLADVPGVEVVAVAEDELALVRLLEAVRVDVMVVALGSDSAGDFVHGLAEEAAVIALVTEVAHAVTALRAGARAVLLQPTSRAEIAAAIQAAVAGLSALSAGLLDDLMRPSSATSDKDALTPRELEVLALIAEGASNKLIARRLGISVHTAKFHVAEVLEKLGAHSRAEAVAIAARLGLVLL
jgi:DNA-binding NarL/FixJ family response regulator